MNSIFNTLTNGDSLPQRKGRPTAEYWRGRAAAARVLAEKMPSQYTRFMMLGVAKDYDLLANATEKGTQQHITNWADKAANDCADESS